MVDVKNTSKPTGGRTGVKPMRVRPNTRTSTVLKRARDLIAERGITKGCHVRSNGRVCAEGAILLALGADENDQFADGCLNVPKGTHRLFSKSLAFLDGTVGVEYGNVVDYNDTPGRRQAQVIKKFNEAIAEAEHSERFMRKLVNA
jgi:hypothetical protein